MLSWDGPWICGQLTSIYGLIKFEYIFFQNTTDTMWNSSLEQMIVSLFETVVLGLQNAFIIEESFLFCV